MRGLFINLIAVNISEISDKTSSATFTNFFLRQNLQINVKYM